MTQIPPLSSTIRLMQRFYPSRDSSGPGRGGGDGKSPGFPRGSLIVLSQEFWDRGEGVLCHLRDSSEMA